MPPVPPKRILMISTHGYFSAEPKLGSLDTGGQVVYVLELSKSLARMGYHVDILTRQFQHQPVSEHVSEGVRLFRLPCGGNDFIPKESLWQYIPQWTVNATKLLDVRSHQYCLINSHYWDAGMAGQVLADRYGITHAHTPHSLGVWKRKKMDSTSLCSQNHYNFEERIQIERKIYNECDFLIATTRQQQRILTGNEYQQIKKKVVVIPAGFDTNRFYPVSDDKRRAIRHSLSFNSPTVLAIGRISESKGYDLMIQAMPKVMQIVKSAKLILALGSSELSDAELEQIAFLKRLAKKLGIHENIKIRDRIPDVSLANYYRAADAFALSSRYEPFGMTAIESLACGTPTVITTQGGLCEYLCRERNIFCANPFIQEEFGIAIACVLKKKRFRESLTGNGFEKIRKKFGWPSIAQRFSELIQKNSPALVGP